MSAPTPERVGPTCLVTGGNGYLGGCLVRRLGELGCRVRALDLAPHRGSKQVESVVGDVRISRDVRAACEGVDTVFHTVALINLLTRYRPETRRAVFDVNVLGTLRVIDACRAAGVRRLVHTSTINVAMGEAVRRGDETARTIGPGEGADLYGESKAQAERAVLEADAAGGLRTTALRLGGLWGPGEGALMISAFLEQLARGRFKALVGDGSPEIDNTYVDNAVDAHLLAAARLEEAPEVVGGRAYFVTDDEPMNGIEWFRPLVEGLGYPWPERRMPGALVLRIAGLLEWVHHLGGPEPTLTRRGILNLTRDASFRIDRARHDLGYEPRVRQRAGIEAMLPELKRRLEIAAARP